MVEDFDYIKVEDLPLRIRTLLFIADHLKVFMLLIFLVGFAAGDYIGIDTLLQKIIK